MIFPNEFEMKLNGRKGLKLFNGTLHYRQVSRWNAARTLPPHTNRLSGREEYGKGACR
jgi:hypothetical protein